MYCSGRCQGLFLICKNPRGSNRSIWFLADDLYNLATAMVLGSTASASSWESFWWAIKALTKVFTTRPDLVIKHKKYLDMLKWEKMDHSIKKSRAILCTINQGIIDGTGK